MTALENWEDLLALHTKVPWEESVVVDQIDGVKPNVDLEGNPVPNSFIIDFTTPEGDLRSIVLSASLAAKVATIIKDGNQALISDRPKGKFERRTITTYGQEA